MSLTDELADLHGKTLLELLHDAELGIEQAVAVRDAATNLVAKLSQPEDAPLPPGAVKRIALPFSGATAIFYRRKGRALVDAQRAADGDTGRMAFALLAQVVEIDGKPQLMEDLEELDLLDVLRLQEAFGELGKLPGPTARL